MQIEEEAERSTSSKRAEPQVHSLQRRLTEEFLAPHDLAQAFAALGHHAQSFQVNAGEAANKYFATPLAKFGESIGAAAIIDHSKRGWSKLSLSVAINIDKAVIANARNVLSAIGNNLNQMAHKDGMPNAVHSGIDTIFNHMWPEVQKDILDSMLLGKGLSFHVFRQGRRTVNVPPPQNPFLWFKATLLYATNAYDMTIFGALRSPLFFFINLLFLFPLYGVADMCVILSWIFMEKFDKHQLVSFITRSKALAFVTSGLISATSAFVKLYVCIFAGEGSAFSCPNYAPGMHRSFFFEFYAYLVRSVLVWVSGLLLWKFDYVCELKKIYDAGQARMKTVPRRALLPKKHSWLALVISWLLAVLALWAFWTLQDSSVNFAGLSHKVANVLTSVEPAVVIAQLFLLTYLLVSPVLTAFWAGAGACLAVVTAGVSIWSARSIWDVHSSLQHNLSTNVRFQGLVIAFSCVTFTEMLFLIHAQHLASKEDSKLRTKLAQVMKSLDQDCDGEVSKTEFRKQFHVIFPNTRFEPMWKLLDKNGDGSLSMTELAAHFGMSHLVTERPPMDENMMDELLNVEERLAQMVATSTLSERAGGLIVHFLVWDVLSTVITFVLLSVQFIVQEDAMQQEWRRRLALSSSKILIGLFSVPFLIFFIPVLSDALTHTKPSGYDRAGNCRHKLTEDEIACRYIITQSNRIYDYNRMKRGESVSCVETIELRWNAFLGFREYNEKDVKRAKQHAKQCGMEMKIDAATDTDDAETKRGKQSAKPFGKEMTSDAATANVEANAKKADAGINAAGPKPEPTRVRAKSLMGQSLDENSEVELPEKRARMCDICELGAEEDGDGRICNLVPEARDSSEREEIDRSQRSRATTEKVTAQWTARMSRLNKEKFKRAAEEMV